MTLRFRVLLASQTAKAAANKAAAEGGMPATPQVDPEWKKEEQEQKRKAKESEPRQPDRGLVAAVRSGPDPTDHPLSQQLCPH